ncbi:hypothetical protein GWN42_13585 [candidate division KSB1 bacterium]|nr:hypothetical protein [candidate division KSB1 bacterium]
MARTVIEEFVALLGWEVDSTEVEEFNNTVDDLGNTLKWVTGLIVGATTAIGALVVKTNQETAEMGNLARSVGLSAESLDALGGVVANIGLNAENVVDLVEEMNNKFGEMAGLGEMTAVEESLKILNLEFKELQKLEPEKQFQEIIDAALRLEDQQKAVAAVDMLLSGEANKIVGFLREQGQTLDEILTRYKEINLLSEEARKGAEKFNMVWGQLQVVIKSLTQLFSGLAGEALAPVVSEFIDFVVQNKELIKLRVKEWVDVFVSTLKFLWSVLRNVINVLAPIVDKFGGLKNTLKLLAIAIGAVKFAKLIKALQTMVKLQKLLTLQGLKKALLGLVTPAGILALLFGILALAIEDLIVFFQGGESFLGKLGDKISEFIHEHITGFIASLFGLSKEEFDLAVVKTFEDLVAFFTETIPEAIDSLIETFKFFFDVITSDTLSFDEKVKLIWEGLKIFIGNIFEGIVDAIAWIYSPIIELTEWVAEKVAELFLKLDEYFPGFTDTVLEIVNTISNAITKVFGFLGTLPDKVIGLFQRAKQGIKNVLADLPGVGGFFGDDEQAPGPPPPSLEGTVFDYGDRNETPLGMRGTVFDPGPMTNSAGFGPSPNVTNTQTTTNQPRTTVSNEINVTQLPGESSQDLARRIKDVMDQSVADAVRNNETGVVY